MSGVLEHSFAWLIVDLCVVGVVLGSLYHLTAIILVLRFPRARKVPRAPFPAVTVLRPLHGDEPSLFARVASLCRQDYPGPVDVTSSAGYSRRMTPPFRWFVCCKTPVAQRSS